MRTPNLVDLRRFRLCFLLSDAAGLITAWWLTTPLRIWLNPFFERQLAARDLAAVAAPIGVVLLLWLPVAAWLAGKKPPRRASLGANVFRAAETALISGALTVFVTFFSWRLGADLSRSFVLLLLAVSFPVLIVFRYIALFAVSALAARWPAHERVAVIGHGNEAYRLAETVSRHAGPGRLAGFILPDGASALPAAAFAAGGTTAAVRSTGFDGVPVLGTTAALAEVINTARLSRVFVVGSGIPDAELSRCLSISHRMGVTLSRPMELVAGEMRFDMTELGGCPVLDLRPAALTRGQEVLKRAFDIVASTILLILLSPALILTAILIKLTSRGPVLYTSTRVGKGGRHFLFLKFRSMYSGSEGRRGLEHANEKSGHIFKMKRDPRVTPLGRLLRRTSFDEMPQLVNVLRGEMSMVGPRPLPAGDLDPDGQSREFPRWAEQRSSVLPGITGLWQIRGRSELTFAQMVELDLEYIRSWSLNLDFRILLETPIVLVTGRGAY